MNAIALSSPVPQLTKREVDPDAIKMFVGQVPKSMDETDLRLFFGRFGEIYQLNVLRDKISGQSRGCCFVTFFTRKAAIESQDALHDKHVLPGMHHPIQMKPADNEKKNLEERKLFVGMISKKLNESDVRRMFSPYGPIEECTVLRDLQGVSRGCAFVTFITRNSALVAIQSMHQSQTMEGCTSPLVVKFADSPKDKEHKKAPLSTVNNNNIWSPMQLASLTAPHQYLNLALLQSMNAAGAASTGYMPNIGGLVDAGAYHSLHNLGLLGVPGIMGMTGLGALGRGNALAGSPSVTVSAPSGAAAVAAAARMAAPTMAGKESIYLAVGDGRSVERKQFLCSLHAASLGTLGGSNGIGSSGLGHIGGTLSSSQLSGVPLISSSLSTPSSSLSSLSHASAFDTIAQACAGIAPYAASFHGAYSSPSTPTQLTMAEAITGRQTEGPDGANLFIYHLPQEFTDADLISAFMPYGNIISAKVFIDKHSNLSKCFGFVSYDSPAAAQAAIQNMNGFQIGMKRLKVQLKRAKNESKPY